MDLKTKFAVITVLGFGLIASVSNLVRLAYLWRLADTPDFLWSTFEIALWATIECGVGLLCGGLAVCRPLLRHIIFHFREDVKPRLAKVTETTANLMHRQETGTSDSQPMNLNSMQSQLSNSAGVTSTRVWYNGSEHNRDDEELGINKTVDWSIENDASIDNSTNTIGRPTEMTDTFTSDSLTLDFSKLDDVEFGKVGRE